MRRLVMLGAWITSLQGCASSPYLAAPGVAPPIVVAPAAPAPLAFAPTLENPVLITVCNHEVVWETVVDVMDDYFRIAEERPVRAVGNVLTEGRLDTLPETGPTLFEPWRRDSASGFQSLKSTLQSMRHYAVVRVIPAERGFRVEVRVFEELEDVIQPDDTTPGDATFRYDTSLTRVVNPVGEQEIHDGWIPRGRDVALEQKIIGELLARFGAPGYR